MFDTYGNQASVTDALGNTTTTTFDTTYYAFPLTVTSPVPDSSNTYGSNSAFVTTATFDTTTGLPLTTTDANGLRTEITYDSTTLRPRYVKYYNGSTQVGPTNETIYHDEKDNYWVKSKTQIDDTNYAESITYFDGLGRAYKAEDVNSDGNVFVEKEFDADGRVSRVSNPFRSGETKVWTTNTYDNASRIVSVTLPDTSTVTTDYGVSTSSPIGVTKTITDQAGKKRKGFSDASGNMVRVVEDPTNSALVTDYLFDTLGNLRKTTQGDQNRYFMHSSVGRLLFAKQVEQDTYSGFSATDPVTSNTAWSAKYEYDDNGNITKTTDAKGWYVEGTYDALGRIKVRNYSDSGTPDVSFYYDGKGLASVPDFSKGKTTKVTSSASETKYMSFDIFGRLLTHRQTTDSVDYDTAYEYNIAGALVEETYPSTRKVKFTTDQDGDLSQVQSKKNSGSGYWTYADAFSYDKNGQLTKFQLGNGRWENYSYNNRQQITQIGLGTTDAATDFLKLEYSYTTSSTTNNNGSLREQKITVPAVGSTSGFTAIQSYTYDDLNRLQSAAETVSSSQTWKQTFTYDRYGNRRFDTTGGSTTTLGSCSDAVCNPTISTSSNRISQSGYTYDANGSLTVNAAGERFVYDAENHQKEFFVASNSGSTPDAVYKYDGEGRRVKKETSSENTVFVYDALGQLVAEYSTALASVQQVSYMTADHLGSPRVTTNENGAVTNRKDFTAFGDEVVSAQRVSGLSGNGYTADEVRKDYTGYEKDSESGLQFAQARYYNTTHGRFTSVDPLTASASIKNPQTFNRYSYVLNSPYKFVDPLGLLSVTTGACGSACPGGSGGGGGAFGIGYTTGMDYGSQINWPQDDRPAPRPIPANFLMDSVKQAMARRLPFLFGNLTGSGDTTSQDSRPFVGDMVPGNTGIAVRFQVHRDDNTVGEDGDHILSPKNGGEVITIRGMQGAVLRWNDQGDGTLGVAVLLENGLVSVYKDLQNVDKHITRRMAKGTLYLSGNRPTSGVVLKEGMRIGTISGWIGDRNLSLKGLHISLLRNLRTYRQFNADRQVRNPGRRSTADLYFNPCWSTQSPFRC